MKSYLSGYTHLVCGITATAAYFVNVITSNQYTVCIALVTLVIGIDIPFIISAVITKNAGINLTFNQVNRQLFFSLFIS